MSQSIQQLQVTEFSNYWTLATAAAVLYDQALNFGQEIDFIWNRKWSVTTILYFIARYSGSLSIGANAASFVRHDWTVMGWINIYLVTNWTTNIFVLAMQAILLIRAYALCGQSKIVLALLLTCYLSLALAVWILTGLCYNLPTMKNFLLYLSPAVGNIEQLSYVNPTVDGNFLQDITIFFISFDILVLLIALYGFITHVLEARRTHGGWSVNNLIRILTADQVLYFLCFVGWMILSFAIMVDSYDEYVIFVNIINFLNVLSVITGPRMVISIRVQEAHSTGGETDVGEELQTIQFMAPALEDGEMQT